MSTDIWSALEQLHNLLCKHIMHRISWVKAVEPEILVNRNLAHWVEVVWRRCPTAWSSVFPFLPIEETQRDLQRINWAKLFSIQYPIQLLEPLWIIQRLVK